MIAGSKTTGRGTSYFATRFIRTHMNTSRCFVNRNWVSGFRGDCDSFLVGSYQCFLQPQVHFPIFFFLRQCYAFLFVPTGQLVWQRYATLPLPSHHAIRNTCMQILPLVEMFCKWELAEDCSDLRALMRRFDSEADLESHELGRSLLCMLHDDDMGMHGFSPAVAIASPANPFDLVRERLAAAGMAIRGLQHQVGKPSIFFYIIPAGGILNIPAGGISNISDYNMCSATLWISHSLSICNQRRILLLAQLPLGRASCVIYRV